jgi:hypothetical protein
MKDNFKLPEHSEDFQMFIPNQIVDVEIGANCHTESKFKEVEEVKVADTLVHVN